MSEPRWVTEAEVARLLDMPAAIRALEAGLQLEADGSASAMDKTVAAWGGHGTLHALGAVAPARGIVGTKTWAHTEGGATPLLILFDAADGSLIAIVEAFALGQLRTGAITGVATARLARPQARALALIGTGKQALAQIAAVAAVRRLERVRVYSPDQARREVFAARAHRTLGLDVASAKSVEEAVRDAEIVVLATRATTPFLSAAALAPGAHVNAIGAIVPSRAEFEAGLFDRAELVVVDSVPAVAALSREFREHYGPPDSPAWAAVTPLSALVAAGASRPEGADLTLFKAMGTGLSDLALGLEVVELVRAGRIGRALAAPERAALRYTSTLTAR